MEKRIDSKFLATHWWGWGPFGILLSGGPYGENMFNDVRPRSQNARFRFWNGLEKQNKLFLFVFIFHLHINFTQQIIIYNYYSPNPRNEQGIFYDK